MCDSVDPDLSRKIKEYALSAGFDLVGIAPVRQLSDHKVIISDWVAEGMNADMGFIARDIEKRIDPSHLIKGARSVIVAGLNYYTADRQGGEGMPVISKYVYGKDYHAVLGEKLAALYNFLAACVPGSTGKVCVDSSSILEKAWAREAGLGWIGRNSILINKELGSFIFLGAIITDIPMDYDSPFTEDLCGSCDLCREKCPTKAINENKTIDARKCIAWVTLENKKEVPLFFKGKINNRILGCDICQDVCPWNSEIKPHNNPEFRLTKEIKKMTREDWISLSPENFKLIFNSSSVERTGYKKLRRNIDFFLSEEQTHNS